jgi:[ribosomal protein S5]-alanine N-acetyltransferase
MIQYIKQKVTLGSRRKKDGKYIFAHVQCRCGEFTEHISTKQLRLRELLKEDAKAVHEYSSDPEVTRYMNWGPNTEEDTNRFIQRSIASQNEQPRMNFTFAMVLKSEDKLIGGCGVYVSNPINREALLGYVLHRGYWGRGYATETASALVEFGFNKLKLHRIFATCDPKNVASVRVLEKVGMQKEGLLRENYLVRGKWRDSLLFAIIENDCLTSE